MKEIVLPITCANIIKILVGLGITYLMYVALIADPFWIIKIGTIGDRPDYWGRMAFSFSLIIMAGWLWIEGFERGWRFPIRCKCDKK